LFSLLRRFRMLWWNFRQATAAYLLNITCSIWGGEKELGEMGTRAILA
jgi:hypothetical protein